MLPANDAYNANEETARTNLMGHETQVVAPCRLFPSSSLLASHLPSSIRVLRVMRGKISANSAPTRCRRVMLKRTYLLGKYEDDDASPIP